LQPVWPWAEVRQTPIQAVYDLLMPDESAFHVARITDIDPVILYKILQLRMDVFIVEQDCAYADMDGRDVDPTTQHLWITDRDDVVSTIRILHDRDVVEFGRIVTAKSARGRGLSRQLIEAAFGLVGNVEVWIGAQAQHEGWYESLGFVRSGPNYLEDDIVHLPMTSPAGR